MSRVFEARFVTDQEKAVSIARRLYDEFYNRKGFFEGYEMPGYILPANLVKGSKEHAWYLTFVISIDYMTDAVKLWRNAREAYRWYPERFNPTMIVELGDKALTSFVRSLGARYPRAGAETWKKISTVLLAQYNGDPRNITPTPLTIQQVKAKLRAFPYLRGNKLSNFYLRAMGENNLLKISNFDELDIPVDIQVARFTVYTGVLRLVSDSFEGCIHKEPLKNLIEEVWRDAARAIGTYPWKLDEPIWTIGSKLCAGKLCSKCPVEDVCAKVKGIKFKGAILIWEKPSG